MSSNRDSLFDFYYKKASYISLKNDNNKRLLLEHNIMWLKPTGRSLFFLKKVKPSRHLEQLCNIV